MAKRGVLGRIALAFVALLVLAGVAMYVINPFHSPLRDPRARITGYTVYRHPSLSMAPTIPEGAMLLVNVATLAGRDPQPGEIVVFLFPPNPRVTYIKRVIAVGGSTIQTRGQDVYVDGRKLDEPYVADKTILPVEFAGMNIQPYQLPDVAPFKVPPGHFFVLGDNRGNSEDSRSWGTVPRELMIGVFEKFLFQPKGATDDE